MGIGLFAVGVAAVVFGLSFVVDDVMGGVDAVGFRTAVYGDAVIGQNDGGFGAETGLEGNFAGGGGHQVGVVVRDGFHHGGACGFCDGFSAAAGQKQDCQQHRDDSFHGIPSFGIVYRIPVYLMKLK